MKVPDTPRRGSAPVTSQMGMSGRESDVTFFSKPFWFETTGGCSMRAQLIPLDGERPITLDNDVTLVGRKPGMCDLIVDRSSVSKLHCLLVKTDGLLFVRDLGSTNGTKVNGQRVTRGALLPGDELAFASVKYTVHLGPDEEEPVGSHESTEMLGVVGQPAVAEPVMPEYDERDSESDVRFLSEEY